MKEYTDEEIEKAEKLLETLPVYKVYVLALQYMYTYQDTYYPIIKDLALENILAVLEYIKDDEGLMRMVDNLTQGKSTPTLDMLYKTNEKNNKLN